MIRIAILWVRTLEELPATEDPVLDALATLCTVTFPYTQIPITDDPFREILLPDLSRSVEATAFRAAVLNDPALRKIFCVVGDTPDSLETMGFIMSSLGSGGSIQLFGYPENLLENAAIWMRLRAQTLDSYFEAASKLIDAARAATDQKPAEVPVIVTLDGTGVPDGEIVSLESGVLHPITNEFLNRLPKEVGHTLTSVTIETSPESTLNKIAGMVFETTVDYELFIEAERPQIPYSTIPIETKLDNLYKKIQDFELGTTLAIIDSEPVKTRHTSITIFDPLLHRSRRWRDRSWANSQLTIADDQQVSQIKDWVDTVSNIDTTRIRVRTHNQ